MRVLITGASGLAGSHLAHACAVAGDEVIGISRSGTIPDPFGDAPAVEARTVDLLDPAAVTAVVREVRPEVVYHLAAQSSVGRSWEDPATTVNDNVATAVNLLEALRLHARTARTVWASSCEVYGAAEQMPIKESAPLQPANPYAVSKVTGDLLAAVYADAHDLSIIRARPFNHAGPGQRPIFLLSSLAQQGAEARLAGQESIQIVTGNPDTRRDFTDVRDVAAAYRMLAERGNPGIYNVCSGISVSAAEQVTLLADVIAPIAVEHIVDPARVRAHEVMEIRGCHAKLHAELGWSPQLTLRETMRDTVAWWEQQLSAARRTI